MTIRTTDIVCLGDIQYKNGKYSFDLALKYGYKHEVFYVTKEDAETTYNEIREEMLKTSSLLDLSNDEGVER